MKGATRCAKQLKSLLRTLRPKSAKATRPAPGDPITQLILGVLTRDVPESKARDVLERIRASVVDYNELRVIPSGELADTIGDYPGVRLKADDLCRALNYIFAREHIVSLDMYADRPEKDIRAYLEVIEGLEAYTRARMRLLGFGKHAIPLDEAMWAYARKAEIVDPECPLEEAQAFLERQIPQKDALDFFAALRKVAWAEMGSAVRRRRVETIASIPPERVSQNMLAMFTAVADKARAPQSDPVAELDAEQESEPAPKSKPARSSKRQSSPRSNSGGKNATGKTPGRKSATGSSRGGGRSKSNGAKTGKRSRKRAAKANPA